MQNQYVDRITKYIKLHPITGTILIINLVMLFVLLLTGGFSSANLELYGGIKPVLVIENNQYYRIVTAMFLHGGLIHFLSNSFVLYFIGGYLERLIGPKRYVSLYMLSGIASSILVVLFSPPNVVTIGASGAIFGVMGALFVLTIIKASWFNNEAKRSIRNLMLFNLVFTFLIPFISIPGHIGGLIFGMIIMYFIIPKLPFYLKDEPQYRGDRIIIEEESNYTA